MTTRARAEQLHVVELRDAGTMTSMSNRHIHRPRRPTAVGGAIAACLAGLLAVVSLAAQSGCGEDACQICAVSSGAVFAVSCSPSDLQSVVVTGPCAAMLSGAALNRGPYISVPCEIEGTAHFVLHFASGFTFERDVTFVKETPGCQGCAPHFRATEAPIVVNNPPSSSCLLPDAGDDARLSDAEAFTE